MPHIVEAGYDTLINIMDYHSNNARMTAAAANKAGLRYVLILKNAAHRKVQGNLLIDKLLGAELHLLDQFQSENAVEFAEELKQEMESEGAKVYFLQEHLFPRIVGMVGFVSDAVSKCWIRSRNEVLRMSTSTVSQVDLCVD